MFDDFCNEQRIAYNILKNGVVNNKCSHAYLINTNGYNKGLDFAKAFAKMLLCNYNYSNCSNCVDCKQCNLIDNNSFVDFKIIDSDGLWIKKDQMDDLQDEFSKKPVSSSKKVYIINGAHNLNSSASNSILKFLEEPQEGIIAILVTDNIYGVLGTIVSRCQIINLNVIPVVSDNMIVNVANELYDDSDKINSFINDSNSLEMINNVINFIKYLNTNGLDTMLYLNELWNFNDSKDDYLLSFDVMIMFYNDIIRYKLGKNVLLIDFMDDISSFSSYNISYIMKCINLLIELKSDIYSNVNLGLLMDKFIIRMEDIR